MQQQRYSPGHQLLHWLTACGMFGVIPLAWLMRTAPEGTALSYVLYRWHETLGLVVLGLTAIRLVVRALDPPPPLPERLSRWDRTLAHATYVLFYGLLLWVPITGFLSTTAAGYPPKLFNLIDTPAEFARNDQLAPVFSTLHDGAQWLVYALIAMHLAGVAFHLVVTRSGILGRMLPAHASEPAPARQSGLSAPRSDTATGRAAS